MKSIIQDYNENPYCYVCRSNQWVEEHHIFYGKGRRAKSERYGLKVRLCNRHHKGNRTGVHGGNIELRESLERDGQKAFEAAYGSREEFREIFEINHLEAV